MLCRRFYGSSVAIGDWEAFVTRELVSYIDGHYRTRAVHDDPLKTSVFESEPTGSGGRAYCTTNVPTTVMLASAWRINSPCVPSEVSAENVVGALTFVTPAATYEEKASVMLQL